MNLVYLPLTDDTWSQFCKFYEIRHEKSRKTVGAAFLPPRPSSGVWVGDERGVLLAGTCFYVADGPFCIVEYASDLPGIGLRLAHRAVQAVIHGIQVYGALSGKNMLCFPRDRGILRMLDRAGFTRSPAICIYSTPVCLSGFTFEPKMSPSQAPPDASGGTQPLPAKGSGGASVGLKRKKKHDGSQRNEPPLHRPRDPDAPPEGS